MYFSAFSVIFGDSMEWEENVFPDGSETADSMFCSSGEIYIVNLLSFPSTERYSNSPANSESLSFLIIGGRSNTKFPTFPLYMDIILKGEGSRSWMFLSMENLLLRGSEYTVSCFSSTFPASVASAFMKLHLVPYALLLRMDIMYLDLSISMPVTSEFMERKMLCIPAPDPRSAMLLPANFNDLYMPTSSGVEYDAEYLSSHNLSCFENFLLTLFLDFANSIIAFIKSIFPEYFFTMLFSLYPSARRVATMLHA